MIYEDLKRQYQLLSEEEKNAFLVYKSKLGLAINDLNHNLENVKAIYLSYKEIVNDPKNIFMKMTVFKDISFYSLEDFKNSLQKVIETMKNASKKIVLKNNITIYRAFSLEKGIKPILLAKENFISTSMDIKECSKFFNRNKVYEHYLYQINLEAFSCVGICPYAILIDENNQLYLTSKNEQQEIILVQDNFDFEEKQTTKISLKEGEINFSIIDAKQRDEEKKYGI